ncbi:type VI secretion system Vgr family protein [Sorangium sp. So ce1335]|uniref:type VI secretion system Vgr family protein n=1 Tax=Sorangium sp. So ce1335 TaxID=3133335 RepID=UPI003F60ACA4
MKEAAEMALAQVFQVSVEGLTEALRVARLLGRERLNAPFSFEITCALSDPSSETDPLSLITAPARLTWHGHSGRERSVDAVVDAAEVQPGLWVLTLVPRAAACMDAVDHRVFVDLDATAIARALLEEHGIALDLRVGRAPPKRGQCIQQFEGDLEFMTRLLAEEGITWFLDPAGDTCILTDGIAGHPEVEGGPLPVREEAGMEAGESVYRVRLVERVAIEEVALRDYNFEKPMLDQGVSAGAGARRVYDYPGGYLDPATGQRAAELRLEEARACRRVLHGETNARGLFAGAVLTLKGGEREDLDGRWLLVEVVHEGHEREANERPYAARFTAIPADIAYRPERSRAPRLGGVQTAVVAGPRGAELHTEEHGRVRVKHRWDRRAPDDGTSSAWTRVGQPATSGALFLPRVGWEVLVGFSGKDGDAPVVLGRLYNRAAPPPAALPREKVVSALGTLTTPGGGGRNRIATDDTAGNEGMMFEASSDFNERTENDKVTAVKADDTWAVGGARKLIVGHVFEQSVTGAQRYSVGGSRTVEAGAQISLSAASESIAIAALRGVRTGGDHTTACATFTRIVGGGEAQAAIEHQQRVVKGGSLVVNGGGWSSASASNASVDVGGVSTLQIAGAKSVACAEYTLTAKGLLSETYPSRKVTAGGAITETFTAAGSYTVGGDATIEGADVSIESSGTLTLKAGGVVVKMSPGKIVISGRFKGDVGSVESGTQKHQ